MNQVASALLAMLFLLGVTQLSPQIDRIYVSQSGAIFLNGKSIVPEALKAELKKLKKANGIVWYARENGAAEPTDKEMVAIKMVVEERLPIQLYTDKTFTTIVKNP